MSEFKCLRCGQCCISVGRTFWRCGDFTGYPELEELAKQTESVDDGLPCQMLQMTDGIASCKIEILYGRKAKPLVCREFPTGPGFDGDCRGHTQEFKGKRICLQEAG